MWAVFSLTTFMPALYNFLMNRTEQFKLEIVATILVFRGMDNSSSAAAPHSVVEHLFLLPI